MCLNLKKKQQVMKVEEIIKFIEERKDNAVYIFNAVSNSDKATESTKRFSHGEMYALSTILEEIKELVIKSNNKQNND